ncbi:MAG TPA: DUF3189 family protein [Firmicutes bacterium]|jgi:hypothetical protein|nr:DUF3189 family protein [Candidatus Fermentithermobacillaceae bacterium]
MNQKITVLIAKRKDAVLGASAERGMNVGGITWGSHGFVGKSGNLFAVWGVTPSPTACRAVTSMLNLYLGKRPLTPRIFYVCYAGTHSSVIASMLHLGMIHLEDIDASGSEILSWMPYFDRRTTADIGVPVLLGLDENGSEVYALGTGWLGRSLELCLCDAVELASPDARACFCSVRGVLDFPARVGGFLSRRLNLVVPGRHLVSRSLSKKTRVLYAATRYCLDLSSKWKDNENHSEGEVIWVDGSKQGRAGLPG